MLTALMATEPPEEISRLDAKRAMTLLGLPDEEERLRHGLGAVETWTVGRAFRFIKWILENNIESYQRREGVRGE